MPQQQAWMPRERWDALVRGEDCPLCAEVASKDESDSQGYRIADSYVSRLRLDANQWVAGYCVLISKIHAREFYKLAEEDQSLFFYDLAEAAKALEAVFSPLKLNFQILGNLVPHVHCHIIPRYYGDPAPGRPIDPHAETARLTADGYASRVELIRSALHGHFHA
jgi:diadenosine tetraphosphate (Ap4A) HIT family hydrolase